MAEAASASGAYPVEDNPSIDLLDMLARNLALVRRSCMIKNLHCPFLLAAYFEAFLAAHSSQEQV